MRYSFSVSQPSRVVRSASSVFGVFGKRVLMLRVVVTRITKSRLQGNRSRLRQVRCRVLPEDRVSQEEGSTSGLRLVLVQKRTRLEFLRRKLGRLYTCEKPNADKEKGYKYKEHALWLSEQSYIKGDGHQEVTE